MADEKGTSSDSLGRPAPPPATRLNKLAVIVAAAVMSVTLLVVTLMVGRTSEQEVQQKAQREERSRLRRAPARADFMDRPPVEAPLQGDLGEEAFPEDEFPTGADPSLGSYAGMNDPSAAYVPPELYEPAPYYNTPAYGEPSPPQKSSDQQALERAMRSSLIPQGFGGLAARQGQPTDEQTDEYQDDDFLSTLAQVQQALGMEGQDSTAPPTGTPTASGQIDPPARPRSPTGNDSFTEPGAQARRDRGGYIATQIEQPSSRFAVREGTLVEAFLITGIHSDLPGEVVAQVARNVYDSETQQALLIPKGTRLIGAYNNQIALDQSRLLVAWTRLIFPDGRSLGLPGLSSKDTQGASGLTGKVNRHFLRAFGNALMLSVVGAGLGLAQRRSDTGGFAANSYPTPGEILSGSVATELSRVATEILRSNAGRRPTIQIEEGTAFNIFINGDLALSPYRAQDGFMRP